MLFNSLAYILLIIFTRMFITLTSKPALLVQAASLFFYLTAGWYDTLIFGICLTINWLITRYVTNAKVRLYASIIFNIGLLAFFKYANFFLGAVVSPSSSSYINVALPLGISFYVFQVLSYQIDVVRGVSKEATSFKTFCLFISFFPHLVAGPIMRSSELLPQIERMFEGKKKRVRLISYGLGLFLLGLIKKVVIADSISPFADNIFTYGAENAAWAWLGAVLFSFQIYLDFSGYSDMAIASAYLLGIKLPTNFKTPYLSRGPREFWQCWHITLSRWIRDYLYIPLGGNRGNIFRAAFTIIATMAIAGLWHGANITFLLWGACWGFYIFLARVFNGFKVPTVIAVAANCVIIVFLWVLFRSPDITAAADYYKIMLGLSSGKPSDNLFTAQTYLFPILVLISVLLYVFHMAEKRLNNAGTFLILKKWDGLFLWSVMGTLIILIILLPKTVINPFIYFRF